MEDCEAEQSSNRTTQDRVMIAVQALVALFLVIALAFHMAELGLVGLAVIVLATAFSGIIEESRLGPAFEEALPFTALLVVFFSVPAVIHEPPLIAPRLRKVTDREGQA